MGRKELIAGIMIILCLTNLRVKSLERKRDLRNLLAIRMYSHMFTIISQTIEYSMERMIIQTEEVVDPIFKTHLSTDQELEEACLQWLEEGHLQAESIKNSKRGDLKTQAGKRYGSLIIWLIHHQKVDWILIE